MLIFLLLLVVAAVVEIRLVAAAPVVIEHQPEPLVAGRLLNLH
jgi:hypothetical protein